MATAAVFKLSAPRLTEAVRTAHPKPTGCAPGRQGSWDQRLPRAQHLSFPVHLWVLHLTPPGWSPGRSQDVACTLGRPELSFYPNLAGQSSGAPRGYCRDSSEEEGTSAWATVASCTGLPTKSEGGKGIRCFTKRRGKRCSRGALTPYKTLVDKTLDELPVVQSV